MKLQLKLKESISERDRKEFLSKLASCGVQSVEPVFPGSPDNYLRSLYSVDTGNRGQDFLHALQKEDVVEIAEPAVERHLA